MKTELRLLPHTQLAGAHVIELWYAGTFVGTVVGADGPGVRVISTYPLAWRRVPGLIEVVEITVQPPPAGED